MKTVLILCLGLGIAAAAVSKDRKVDDDPIISLESNIGNDGKFHYHYETGQHVKATQDGSQKHIAPDQDGEAIEGEFSYVSDDDGKQYSIQYTADENGYQPHGEHIPTPPPIPEAIQRALTYIAAHPYVDPKDKVPLKG